MYGGIISSLGTVDCRYQQENIQEVAMIFPQKTELVFLLHNPKKLSIPYKFANTLKMGNLKFEDK